MNSQLFRFDGLSPSRVLKKGLIAVFNGQITVGDVPWEGLG
jgi:hypothetical protein